MIEKKAEAMEVKRKGREDELVEMVLKYRHNTPDTSEAAVLAQLRKFAFQLQNLLFPAVFGASETPHPDQLKPDMDRLWKAAGLLIAGLDKYGAGGLGDGAEFLINALNTVDAELDTATNQLGNTQSTTTPVPVRQHPQHQERLRLFLNTYHDLLPQLQSIQEKAEQILRDLVGEMGKKEGGAKTKQLQLLLQFTILDLPQNQAQVQGIGTSPERTDLLRLLMTAQQTFVLLSALAIALQPPPTTNNNALSPAEELRNQTLKEVEESVGSLEKINALGRQLCAPDERQVREALRTSKERIAAFGKALEEANAQLARERELKTQLASIDETLTELQGKVEETKREEAERRNDLEGQYKRHQEKTGEIKKLQEEKTKRETKLQPEREAWTLEKKRMEAEIEAAKAEQTGELERAAEVLAEKTEEVGRVEGKAAEEKALREKLEEQRQWGRTEEGVAKGEKARAEEEMEELKKKRAELEEEMEQKRTLLAEVAAKKRAMEEEEERKKEEWEEEMGMRKEEKAAAERELELTREEMEEHEAALAERGEERSAEVAEALERTLALDGPLTHQVLSHILALEEERSKEQEWTAVDCPRAETVTEALEEMEEEVERIQSHGRTPLKLQLRILHPLSPNTPLNGGVRCRLVPKDGVCEVGAAAEALASDAEGAAAAEAREFAAELKRRTLPGNFSARDPNNNTTTPLYSITQL